MVLFKQSSYLREVRESQKVFSALVNAMEKSHKAVVAAIEERQREEETRVETLVKELEQEIRDLRKEAEDIVDQVPDTDQSDTKQVTQVGNSSWINTAAARVSQTNLFFMFCRAPFQLFPSLT